MNDILAAPQVGLLNLVDLLLNQEASPMGFSVKYASPMAFSVKCASHTGTCSCAKAGSIIMLSTERLA